MKLFKKFLESVLGNKARIKEGKVNCIPLPFQRLNRRFPGIQQAKQVIVTANSGVGKTQFTKFLYVFWPYVWTKENADTGITFKCKYFALEESQEEFIASAYSFFLNYYYGVQYDTDAILSMYEELPDEIVELMNELEDVMEDFLDKVEIIDSVFNPTGIYKNVREYSENNGTHYYYNFRNDPKKLNPITHAEREQRNDKKDWAYSHYTPHRPDEYFIIVVDHISLINAESGMSHRDSMGKLSADYGRKNFTKQWKYTFVMVQQQNSQSEKKQFDSKGKNIVSKLKPSMAELANNTETHRDALVVWTLFAPSRYEIESYGGYNIRVLKDNYRELTLEKNRGGQANLNVPLYYNGAVNFFKELPKFSKEGEELQIGEMDSTNWYSKFKQNKEFWI